MEKTSIAIAFKGSKMEVLKVGEVPEVLDAYNEAKGDESYDFVGMLRKPRWYKRATPKRSRELTLQRRKNEEERAKREAEYAAQEEARLEARIKELREQQEIESAKASLKKEDAKKANDLKNEKLKEMEEKERQSKIEEQLENQISIESDKGLSPSTEEEKASAPAKKSAKKKTGKSK